MGGPRERKGKEGAGDEQELVVERLVNGPGALARSLGGRIVLLDEGLPGERVRVRVDEERRDFLRARVIRRLSSSTGRREPRCPVVALCGGCPWQVLDDRAQVAAKQEVVLREIRRVGGLEPEEVRPPLVGSPWGSRHRVRLAVDRRTDPVPVVGYRMRGSRDVVPIDDCAIARTEIVAALPIARRLAQLERRVREIELTVDDRGAVRVLGRTGGRPSPSIEATWSALQAAAGELAEPVVGLVLESADRDAAGRREAGDVLQRMEVAPGIEIGVPVGTFTQVNSELNRELVAAVVAEATESLADGLVLDLYCGAGNFGLAVARRGRRVVGVDVDPRAVAAASASAKRLGLGEAARFEAAPALPQVLERLGLAPDVVILDPPRAGAAEVLPAVLAGRPERLIYVSCDLATFARDARKIVDSGWRFASLRLVDLTPQTHRAEVMCVFRLTWEGGGPYRAH